jgi:CTP synthase
MVQKIKKPKHQVKIGVVGKYTEVKDAYKSITESLIHGGIANDAHVSIHWIEATELEGKAGTRILNDLDGILVPGGFGHRGIEGKIEAVRYAREKKRPYFGICLGMQVMAIEFSRHVMGLKGANSTEFDSTSPHPVISLLEEQKEIKNMGGTMRLGAYPCRLSKGTHSAAAYGEKVIFERHRHRYEFNNLYREQFANKGMILAGLSPDETLVEILEVKNHPWMLGVQFHPEFKSKPTKAHPLFSAFIAASLKKSRK